MPPGIDAVAHVLVQRRALRVALEHLAKAAAEARAPRFVERELARRQQPHVRDRVERALRVDVEGLDALDVVAEEVEPVGQRAAHREEVDQPAADAELAGRDDLRDVLVAGERELRAQRVDVEPRALLQEERERGEVRRRREPVERRRRRDDQHVALAARRRGRASRGAPRRGPGAARSGRRAASPSRAAARPAAPARTTAARRRAAARRARRRRRRRAGAPSRAQADAELRDRQRVGGAGERAARALLAGCGKRGTSGGSAASIGNGRGGGGSRGRGGGAAPARRQRASADAVAAAAAGPAANGRWHVQLRIERELYVGAIAD